MNKNRLFFFTFSFLLANLTESKPLILEPKEILENGIHALIEAVMDRLADLDKSKPKEKPKEILVNGNHPIIDSFKIAHRARSKYFFTVKIY